MNDDKPKAATLGWSVRQATRPYENKTLALRVDDIDLAEGHTTQYAYIERAPAVIIVPVTRDGQIVTLNQYRYPVDDWCIEVPAGGTHDTGDDSLEEVARKELREETGGTCAALTSVGWFYSGPALLDEKCHVYLAENVDVTREPSTEPSEVIKIRLIDAAEAVEMARTGKMTSSPSALAVLICEPLLRERGYI
jgi:ADP-ribose pyrophosphatase